MGVLPPSLVCCALSLLSKKFTPTLVPTSKRALKRSARCSREGQSNGTKFFSRLQPWSAREALGDEHKHVKVTVLNRNSYVPGLQHLPYTSPSIDRERCKSKSCTLKGVDAYGIIRYRFTGNLSPIQVAPIGTAYENTIAPGEECCIHREADRIDPCTHFSCNGGIAIKVLSQCLWILPMPVFQFRICLLSRGILGIGTRNP